MHSKNRKFYRYILCALMLVSLLSPTAPAQTSNASATGEALEVSISDEALAEVAGRILRWYFAPRKVPAKIDLVAGSIKKEWLPQIKNIEFRLLSDAEIETGRETFFFTEPEFTGGRYEIGFGHGTPRCNTRVETWYFRTTQTQKVRLWKRPDGFGSGCAIAAARDYLVDSFMRKQSKKRTDF